METDSTGERAGSGRSREAGVGKISAVRRLALVPLVVLVLGLPALLVACGGGETRDTSPETVEGEVPQEEQPEVPPEGDAAAGARIFEANGCGGCHILEAAGGQGTTGPNLDETQPSYEEAYVQTEEGGGGMPAFGDQLSEKEIADVAAFVADNAGGGGE